MNETTAIPANLTDIEVKELWEEFEKIETRETRDGVAVIKKPWRWFKGGTPLEVVHNWFDENHSGGILYLMFGMEE